MIAGHEGAGEIVAIGSHIKSFKIGDKVGIKFITRICGYCEYCHTSGRDNNCENQEECAVTRFGTFQEYIAVAEGEAVKLPNNIDLKKAAPLMCGGVTVYKGLKETGCIPGEIVAICGAAGGLGSFAIHLGANYYINASKSEITKNIYDITDGKGPHAVVVVANAVKAFEDALQYVRKYGVVVAIGVPERQISFNANLLDIIVRHITIKGSTLGNRQDFKEAVHLLSSGKIDIPIEIRGLSELPEVLQRIGKGKIQGRVVLDTSK